MVCSSVFNVHGSSLFEQAAHNMKVITCVVADGNTSGFEKLQSITCVSSTANWAGATIIEGEDR
ncbi:hypothetical protein SOVF_210610 [Spinacia oleracea]|nr:hypothetical protein SOVF_210610 [Spinacia oleracea]